MPRKSKVQVREVKVKDLPDQIADQSKRGIFLYCEVCGQECSAHAGDYWQLPKDKVMTCCDTPMRLVRKETRLVDVV